jgi:uncharacterized protein (TIGR02996 family)
MRRLAGALRDEAIAALRRRKAPELDVVERELLATVRGQLGLEASKLVLGRSRAQGGAARSEEEHLDAIARDLDDDAPRLVYADWLSGRGDARGELIALSCASATREITGAALRQILAAPAAHDAATRRIAKLLKKHRKAWMGPLADVVEGDEWAFDRGFLGSLGYRARYVTTARSLIGARAWSTLRRLHFCDWQQAAPRHGLVELVSHPAMANLRTLSGLSRDGAMALSTAPAALPLTELRWYGSGTQPPILAAPALPRLERMTMAMVRQVDELAGAPLLDQLRELTVMTDQIDARALLAHLVAGRRRLSRFVYRPGVASLDVRGLDADAIELVLEVGRGRLAVVTDFLASNLPVFEWRRDVLVPLLERHAAALGADLELG